MEVEVGKLDWNYIVKNWVEGGEGAEQRRAREAKLARRESAEGGG